jgi:DNA-binding transcriptional MerR regulator
MLEITPVTLRRWCEYHAEHLSAGANPQAGKARRFTGRDLEVFKHVRSLRAQGLTVADINEQLQALTFAVVDTDEQSAGDSEELAPVASQESLHDVAAIIQALSSHQAQIDAIQQANRRRFDTVTVLGIGICIGLLFSVGMIVLAWLYGG